MGKEGGDIDSGGEDGYVGADKDNGNVPTQLSTLTHHHKKSPSSSFSEVKFVGERVSDRFYQAGRQESEHLLGTIVGQYRRLLSTCAVRAQAMCTLARVGLITPASREAARRRQVAMRMEVQMREERKAQWMASLRGPGWARRGRCHGV